jgi:hypothetical protein
MGLLGASLLTSYRYTRDFSAGGQTPRALRALQKAKSGGRSSEQSILNQGRVSLSQCNSWRPWRVRFGSFTSFSRCPRYVRSSPNSGGKADVAALLIRAHLQTHAVQ